MVNQKIIDYVKTELKKGVAEDKLRHVLIGHGWPESEINEAFEKAKAEQVPEKPAVPAKEMPAKTDQPQAKTSAQSPAEIIEQAKAETEAAIKGEQQPETGKPGEAKKKPMVMDDVKKILTNKIFIISAVVIFLGTIAAFVLPLMFEGPEEVETVDASEEAINMCRQYCNSNLCGLFIKPDFTDPELKGKNCLDIGVKCPQQNDCTAEYP